MLHRTRDLLIRQRTQLINALRAHLAELGLAAAKGHEGLQQLIIAVTESGDERLPGNARFACQAIIAPLHAVQTQINGLDKRVTLAHRANADSKRLEAIPGFGVILSTAVVATMTDPKAFRTGREFAAWIGLVPQAELHRRQGAPRLDFQTGRSLSAATIRPRCNIHCQDRTRAAGEVPLADTASRPAAVQGCCGGAGQQDGAGRLGSVGQGEPIGPRHAQAAPPSQRRPEDVGNGNVRLRRGRTGKSRVMMV